MRRSYLLRLAVYLGVIAVLLLLPRQWRPQPDGSGQEATDEPVSAEGAVAMRRASAAEWAKPIAVLGRQRLAKHLAWRQLAPGQALASGQLLWWHDGEGERLAYLAAPGEDPQVTSMAVAMGLRDGRIVMWDLHGDASLMERIFTLPVDYQLPPGWTVLRHPDAD